MRNPQFVLVEPVANTPFPPLGLLKISSMLKDKHKGSDVFSQVGCAIPKGLRYPDEIFITSLFTWHMDDIVKTIFFFQDHFPGTKINVGGIAASMMPSYIKQKTGIDPHIGILTEAEGYPPDYTQSFGRKINASITFASRGCPRHCKFCGVRKHEPVYFTRNNWEQDVSDELKSIIFWDNNWLASPNLEKDCHKIKNIGKPVDFNQGLDARYYNEKTATLLSAINIDPIRFAFDEIKTEEALIKALRLAKKYSNKEIRVYVLYNFEDTPEDFFHKIDLLNREKVLSFPMQYREFSNSKTAFPGKHWNKSILRALKLSLLYYYRKGMITESRKSFIAIYGNSPREFLDKLYTIYEYDKKLEKKRKKK